MNYKLILTFEYTKSNKSISDQPVHLRRSQVLTSKKQKYTVLFHITPAAPSNTDSRLVIEAKTAVSFLMTMVGIKK